MFYSLLGLHVSYFGSFHVFQKSIRAIIKNNNKRKNNKRKFMATCPHSLYHGYI